MRSRKQFNENIRRAGALLIVIIFVLGAVVSTNNFSNNQQAANTPTLANPGVPTVAFPTVPAGGNPVVADYTYFQSSGLFSLPHLVGWDLAPASGGAGAEEKIEAQPTAEGTPVGTPVPGSQISRVGVTFINSTLLSVVHAFAERDPERQVASVNDLDKYYDKNNLDGAWKNFTGGWKELNRGASGDQYIVNFELYLDSNTYLGRQISHLNGDWLMVLRLVVPNNNPQLLDTLQNNLASHFTLWTQALNSPLTWSSIVDYAAGYVVKYPPDWKQTDGSAGHPFTVNGTLPTGEVTLTSQAMPNTLVRSEDEARAWLKTNIPNGVVQTIKSENHGEYPGFAVSYADPDPDGNQRSAVVSLISGPSNTLYVVNMRSTARQQNLLDDTNTAIPPEFAKIRAGIFLIPTSQLVATLTPTITPTPLPTATPTAAGTASAAQ